MNDRNAGATNPGEEPAALASDRRKLCAALAAWLSVPEGQVTFSRQDADTGVADMTYKYRVSIGSARDAYFVHLSPKPFPAVISDTFARARAMAEHLGAVSGSRVLLPVWESALDGRSFAVTRTVQRISSRRLLKNLQGFCLGRHLFDWLVQAVRETRREVGSDVPGTHLQRLIDMTQLDSRIRRAASVSQELFLSSRLRSFTAFNHRDLWTGNVLYEAGFPRWLPTSRIAVIDWGAATLDAAPGYDAAKFALDARIPHWYARARFADMARVLECRPDEFPHYVLASMAALACNLDNWPEAAFRVTCEQTFDHALKISK